LLALAGLLPLHAGLRFVDATAGSGIDYRNVCGAPRDKGWITEHMGAGAAWLDYDGDGHLDLYVANGSTHDRPAGQGEPDQLYRGDGRGHFQNVTQASGTGDRFWSYGVAVGDIDNDGDPDIYVTNLGPSVLYLNRGDGTFEDVSARAGVAHSSWSTSAAFFDMEGDGDLDLYVGTYVDFVLEEVPRKGSTRAKPPYCAYRGYPVFCGPRGLRPAQDVLYRNNGDGTFTDVTRASGVWLEQPRYALGVVTADYDNDGDQDVYVANDSVPNSLWRNRGDGTFEDVGLVTLTALNGAGQAQGSMGTAFGDYNGDGWLDLVVTNFTRDVNTIYRSAAGKFFVDESAELGMGVTLMELSWGVAFHDFDHDADLDLFIANGHVYEDSEKAGFGSTYEQPNHAFVNEGGTFHKVESPGTLVERSWRGAAFGDYDEDGDVDIFLTAMDAPGMLLRNDTPKAGHHLQLDLRGGASNRDAVGTRVQVTAGGRTLISERCGGGSYLSASDPKLHFGLGRVDRVERVDIRWPGGRRETLTAVGVDRVLVLREPGPVPARGAGSPPGQSRR
jgi:hypothetical protein